MIKCDENFFDWLRSIDLLNEYDAALDISVDYATNQSYRLSASDYVHSIYNRYQKEVLDNLV